MVHLRKHSKVILLKYSLMLHYSIAFLKVKVLYVWVFFSGDDQHSTELGRQDPGWTDGDTN